MMTSCRKHVYEILESKNIKVNELTDSWVDNNIIKFSVKLKKR